MKGWIKATKKNIIDIPNGEYLCLLENDQMCVLKMTKDKEGYADYTPLIPYDPFWVQQNEIKPVTYIMKLPELPKN